MWIVLGGSKILRILEEIIGRMWVTFIIIDYIFAYSTVFAIVTILFYYEDTS